MIEVLVHYGSALYWALLFFGIYLITIYAEQRHDTLRPNIWAGLTAFFVMGFTDWHPNPTTLLMGIIAYFTVGLGFAIIKWIGLVVQVRTFTDAFAPLQNDDMSLRCMAQEHFKPNNARGGCMMLPPDPYEFRTRLWLWFMYWPSFSVLRPLTHIHKYIALGVWNLLCSLSKDVYDSRNKS